MSAVRTTCPYCGVGCGVLAAPEGVKGDKAHPANAGRLCSKGTALGETLGLDDRLAHPMIGGARAPWDAATALVANKFKAAVQEHGPDSVAFYVSGQLLTEDYYVANKLMKGFIGSANIDTNSRLCMASSVAGHKRAFGEDVVPGVYEDLEEADLVVLVGSNLAWCHPVLSQRLSAARKARPHMRVVNIDPRRTATSDIADSHLSLAPGSDVALFNGLLRWLSHGSRHNAGYVARHVAGTEAALEAAAPFTLARVAAETGLEPDAIRGFYDMFARTPKTVTVYSQGVNQWSCGTDKVNAILNCHLFTGRIGKPGCGPFSVTGQPNAMGGREVGGLATMLAAHLEIDDPAHRDIVQGFWASPTICARPGLKAVDMFEAVADGRIKALWIMATNPVVSLPDADAVRAALKNAFVVVSDVTAQTDTARCADVLLPALAWGEKDGTVTNSDRLISRQRAFTPPPGEARADWRIIRDVAAAMGWGAAFDYGSPAEIFREHAALSGLAGRAGRKFDISGAAEMSAADYDAMEPFRWPAPSGAALSPRPSRLFAKGGFSTPDGRGRMLALTPRDDGADLSAAYPLVLNTGRVRDHWHTMTRTAKSARLSRHIAEPYMEVHPSDAARLGLSPAALATLSSAHGQMIARVLVTDRQRPGSVFAPMHWSAETASLGRVCALVAPVVDPVSGQPQSKRTPVSIAPFAARWHGFAVTAAKPERLGCAYWAAARCAAGWRIEVAGDCPLDDPRAFAAALLGCDPDIAYEDAAAGRARYAALGGQRGAVFFSPEPTACARDWLADAVASDAPGLALLAGGPGAGAADQGPIVCVCESVGARRIEAAAAAGAATVEAVGAACGAGTNCGSCRPEIAALIRTARAPAEAAE